jgi:hypothetical protein
MENNAEIVLLNKLRDSITSIEILLKTMKMVIDALAEDEKIDQEEKEIIDKT